MKCEADASPITLLRRAIGRTSAPYNQVVLFNIQHAIYGTLVKFSLSELGRVTYKSKQQTDKCPR
jgi:hypothetical protein